MKRTLRVIFTQAVFGFSLGLQPVFSQLPEPKPALPEPIKNTLNHAESFILLSLNPERLPERKPKSDFHGFGELGKVEIRAGRERTNLLAALYAGIASNYIPAECFNPRHGIRATQGTNTVELLICFECCQLEAFSTSGSNYSFATAPQPAKLFNAALRRAKVRLPKTKRDD